MFNTNNLCFFQGRISNDPQYSTYTANGAQGQFQMEKALFKIAVDRALSSDQRQKVKNGDGSIKTADFIPCSLSGAQVATLRQYFYKGKGISVFGHYEEYTTKNPQTGETKYGHTFVIEKIGFCIQDPKNAQNNQNQGQQNYQQPQYQPPQGGYPQGGYQQSPQQYQQPQPQQNNGFSMFDESSSPF